MMWGHPWLLLAVIPVLIALALEVWQRHALAANLPKVSRVWAGRDELTFERHQLARPVRWRLWLGVMLLIVAAAKPRYGVVQQTVYDPAIDVVLAMDLSRSMLAKDVRPSRLEHGRILALGMLDRFVGVRVGFVPFAGVSYVQMPLSLDYQILIETLGNLSPDGFPRGGTNYAAMVSKALEAFGEDERRGRFLVVISDGETSDARWRELVPQLVEHHIQVIAVAVGTATGAVIPAKDGGVVVDRSGAEVLSRFSPVVLEELAKATGGVYLQANAYVALADVINQMVAKAPQHAPAGDGKETLAERFQWVLGPAVLVLLGAYWLDVPYRPHHRRIELPEAAPEKHPIMRSARGGVAGAVASVVLLGLGVVVPLKLGAIDGDENSIGPGKRPNSPVDGQAILLSKRVEQILEHPVPNAIDYAGFVIDSMGYIETKLRIRERAPMAVIRDALAAVEAGWAADPEAADWPRFRREIRAQLERTLAPTKVYAAESAENISLEALLAMAEAEQKNRRNERADEADDGSELPPDLVDKPSRKAAGSAFGDLVAEEEPQPNDAPATITNEPTRRPRPGFTLPGPKAEPDLALPLHRLAQIRSQDSPARLYQLMESDELPVSIPRDDW